MIAGLILLVGCGGPPYYTSDAFADRHPGLGDMASMSLLQGCPVEGASASHLRKSYGTPVVTPVQDSASSEWRFRLDDRSSLDVLVHGDTVVRWDVSGRPSPRIAQRNYAWSQKLAKGFPDRAIEYLDAHPDLSPRTAFLILRACAVPGLSAQALRASWGMPSRLGTRGDTAHWIYGFGVEGQHDVILLVSDTVRAFRSVEWTPGE